MNWFWFTEFAWDNNDCFSDGSVKSEFLFYQGHHL